MPPLPEAGTSEVKNTIRSFNAMQQRQQRFVKDRTLMLAAISHDLRTPLTKFKLQTEFVQDEALQRQMQETVQHMQHMLNETLSFAKNDAQTEASTLLEISRLVQSLCDDFTDAGHTLTTALPDQCLFSGRKLGLKRMLSNTIDNACSYGAATHVVTEMIDKQGEPYLCIRIEDNGPGIPDAQLEQVFQPFFRVEESRNRHTGGTGLGLCVVRTVAHLHGGDVTLYNRDKGGLALVILLPTKRQT